MSDDLTPIGSGDNSPMPFERLIQPQPSPPTPPEAARWAAFAGILVGGLLGGLIGYGTSDLLTDNELFIGLGTMFAASVGAIGVGIMASLTLRAMGEWKATQHPEESKTKPEEGPPQ